MPEAREQAQAHLSRVADKQWLLLVGHSDRQKSLALAEQIKTTLVSPSWQFIDTAAQFTSLNASYWPYRYFLLADSDRQLLSNHNTEQLFAQAQQRLYSPLGAGLYDPVGDPLFLFQHYTESLALDQPIQLQDGWPTLFDANTSIYYRLLRFELSQEAFVLAADTPLPEKLSALKAVLPSGAVLLNSGLIFHAAHGAAQARTEITVIGAGSLIGVLLVLLLAFGRALLPMLMPLAAGLLVAFSASVLVFDRVHLITLAFGASLIGVGIDYAIHARMALNHGEPLASLKQPLLLGLLTSVLAYGLQGLMPFPGLRQMAWFSCVGLIACWVSVWLWFPQQTTPKAASRGMLPLYYCADAWLQFSRAIHWANWLKAAVFFVAVVSLLLLPGDDGVDQLQTSPAEMLQQEQQVNRLLQGPQPGRYFVVVGADATQLDAQVGALVQRLNDNNIHQTSYRHWLPAQALQARNRQLLENVYHPSGELDRWYSALGAEALTAKAVAQFDAAASAMDLTALVASPLGAELQHFVRLEPNPLAIVYVDQPLQVDQLAALAGDNWDYVDRVQELTGMLASHRVQLLRLLVLALFLLCAVTLLLGKSIQPSLFYAPAIAASVALWLVSVFAGGVNLFHCLAVLLVLGVGFDNSLILSLAGNARVAWRGATVSVLTSLLAFGLLAACTTPVLKSFGTVAALGLLLVWLLVPIMATSSDSPLRN